MSAKLITVKEIIYGKIHVVPNRQVGLILIAAKLKSEVFSDDVVMKGATFISGCWCLTA